MTIARPVAASAAAAVLAYCFTVSSFAQGAANGATSSPTIFQVGDVLPEADVHIVTSPGVYGLGPEPPGSRYAVAHGMLIRVDAETTKVLSVLREQARPLD